MQTFDTRRKDHSDAAAGRTISACPGATAVSTHHDEIDITFFAKAIGLTGHLEWEVSERERKSGQEKTQTHPSSVILRLAPGSISIDLRSELRPVADAKKTETRTTVFPHDGTACESVFWGCRQPLSDGVVSALNDFLLRHGIHLDQELGR